MTLAMGVSREDQVLLLLGRGTLTPEAQANAQRLLEQALSWPRILRDAEVHGVLPLLARNLERFGWAGVPSEVRAEVERASNLNAVRNRHLVRELVQVLRRFQEAGVTVIPLKGVALADSLYGDVTLRTCSDLDVLVPRHAVPQAIGLLLADGYQEAEADRFEMANIDLLLNTAIAYAFARRRQTFPYLLELHWDLAWRWRRDTLATDLLWAEAHPTALWGVQAYALSPEWELLYLAVHAAHHRWQALKWLVDIHEACARGDIDWEKLSATATRLGWDEALRLTLGVCHTLFETPMPTAFRLQTLPPWLRLFPVPAAPGGLWQDALFATRLFPRPSEKLRYLVRLLLVPTLRERRLLRLPRSLGLLYYSLRPVRLGVKWGWRGVRQSSTTQKT